MGELTALGIVPTFEGCPCTESYDWVQHSLSMWWGGLTRFPDVICINRHTPYWI